MTMANCKGTIRGIPDGDGFDPLADASYVKYCMDGFGTKDTKLMTIITDRTNEQRLAMAAAYEQEFGGSLVDRIRSETSGKYEKTLVALMTSSALFDAKQIRLAVAGLGTNENLLSEIICTRTGEELAEIREAYAEEYGEDLMDRLTNETSDDYRKYLVRCVENRPEEDPVDPEDGDANAAAAEAANQLHAAAEGWRTDKGVFVEILASNTFDQLERIANHYERLYEKSLVLACKSELRGHFERAVVLTVEQAKDPVRLWGKKIRESMKGFGTDDERLIQLMVSRSERDLLTIRNRFGTEFGDGTSLGAWIESDTSGKYRKALLLILNADQRDPILQGVENDEDDDEKEEPYEPAVEEDPPVETDTPGLRVALKSWRNTYLSAREDGTVVWSVNKIDTDELFELGERGDDKITLKSYYGFYLCAQGNYQDSIRANRQEAMKREEFTLEKMEDEKYAFRTAHNCYLTAQADGSVSGHGVEAQEWEKVRIIPCLDASDGGTVSFKCHDLFMSAQEDGTIQWNRTEVLEWEKFTIENHDDKLAFRSFHGMYLCAESDLTLCANRSEVGDWEKFDVVQESDRFSLRSAHGFFVSCDEDGTVTVESEEIGANQQFTCR